MPFGILKSSQWTTYDHGTEEQLSDYIKWLRRELEAAKNEFRFRYHKEPPPPPVAAAPKPAQPTPTPAPKVGGPYNLPITPALEKIRKVVEASDKPLTTREISQASGVSISCTLVKLKHNPVLFRLIPNSEPQEWVRVKEPQPTPDAPPTPPEPKVV